MPARLYRDLCHAALPAQGCRTPFQPQTSASGLETSRDDPHCHKLTAIIQPDPDRASVRAGCQSRHWDTDHRQEAESAQQMLQSFPGAEPSQQCWQAQLLAGVRRKPYGMPSLLKSRPEHCKNVHQSFLKRGDGGAGADLLSGDQR